MVPGAGRRSASGGAATVAASAGSHAVLAGRISVAICPFSDRAACTAAAPSPATMVASPDTRV